VVVWAHELSLAQPNHLVALTELANRPSLMVAAGPGWSGVPLPTWVNWPPTLGDAVALLGSGLS
jgi:hypothetical protein